MMGKLDCRREMSANMTDLSVSKKVKSANTTVMLDCSVDLWVNKLGKLGCKKVMLGCMMMPMVNIPVILVNMTVMPDNRVIVRHVVIVVYNGVNLVRIDWHLVPVMACKAIEGTLPVTYHLDMPVNIPVKNQMSQIEPVRIVHPV